MPNETVANHDPTLYALLIGIDHYLPNMLPDGSIYRSLGGSVNDVTQIEALLKRRFGLQEDNIIRLTATKTDDGEPPEPPCQWPTYENMVAAFQRVTELAQPDDYVYIHYSGHGGRARTLFPEAKGPEGIDETLVPLDIGNDAARYLRDVEMAKLLKDMVDKGLVVAVVLDSCHSGGMTRGLGDVAVRGLDTVDTTERPAERMAGTLEELGAHWDQLTRSGTRDVSRGSGWLPEPEGYTLLAACRSTETASEFTFEGSRRHGVLTYWLLDALEDAGPGLSYKMLHDRIVARVHSQFEQQTPQLQGEGDREFLGSNRIRTHYHVPVMDIDEEENRLLLGAGEAQGLHAGARFAVYPHSTADFEDPETRLALVELTEVGAVVSWAAIRQDYGRGAVAQGDQALFLGKGAAQLVRRVALAVQEDLDPAIGQDAALRAVAGALEGEGWVEVATHGEEIAYNVAVNADGEYEIWDGSGQVLPNLRPALRIDDPAAPSGVARRLVHLSKYHAVQQLHNDDPDNPMARRLVVELAGKRADYDPAGEFEAEETLDEPGGTPTLTAGEWVGVRILNRSLAVVNVTAVVLDPGWGITQVYPAGEGDYFVTFEPRQEKILPLETFMPEGYEEGRDVVKVFATLDTANFRWLELPHLDQPQVRSAGLATPANPLEELLSAFTADQPVTRRLQPSAYPSQGWITAQVEFTVRRT